MPHTSATPAPATPTVPSRTPATTSTAPPPRTDRGGEAASAPRRRTTIPGNLLRGALIGTVETVPGVSGGTVALVVGVYHELIDSASALVSAVRALGRADRRTAVPARLAEVRWRVVLPVIIGMAAAVLTIAEPMADAVEQHPVAMRGLFLGMVLASLAVPLLMVRRSLALADLGGAPRAPSTAVLVLAGAIAAVATFALVSLEPTNVAPSTPVIVLAASVAVSALVLPGLSGSFLLLALGLYEPTLRAVAERDLAYLAPFALGALLGLALVVKALQRLLARHEAVTLAALTGLMVGGARALWPWQADGELLAPGEDAGTALALGAAGFALVAVLIVVDEVLRRREGHGEEPALHD